MPSDILPEERARLAVALPKALENGEIIPYYQPKISARDACCVGAEALARWRSPTHGTVLPDKFIPYAEESALIVSLGESILHSVCRNAASWAPLLPSGSALSLNVSPAQLSDRDFPGLVGRTLAEHGLVPSDLEFEITEQIAIQGIHGFEDTLHDLHTMGVRFTLDDFGTGYASLALLIRLPLDVVKLDRSLLQGLHDDPAVLRLIRGTCALAHDLGLSVVAEGIDVRADLEILGEAGCDVVQGFCLGEPMPAEAFEQFLSQSREKDDDL